MSKNIPRANVAGSTLPGASLKTSLTGLIDALNSAGIQEGNRTTVAATSTLTITQCGLVLVDATSASIVLTLPTSGTTADDAVYLFRRIDSSANTVTIQRGGTDTAEGASAALSLASGGGILGLQMPAGGTNWRIYSQTAIAAAALLVQTGLGAALIAQTATAVTSAGTAPAYTITTSLGASTALAAGQRFRVKLHAAGTTGSNTLNRDGLGAKNLMAYDPSGAKVAAVVASGQLADIEYDGTDMVILDPLPPSAVLRSYLSGLTLSTAGASTTMTIAAGQASDSANAVTMNLAAGIGKTTSAWAVGTAAGGLDTGAIAVSTWYYWYLIRRPDTGVVDVVFSLSSTSPTLPTNYTQYRYIGAGLTNGSSQWTKFTQFGDEFTWDTPVLDFNGAGSATAALLTCSVPRGRKCKVLMNLYLAQDSNQIYLSDPANSDLAPSTGAVPLSTIGFNSASLNISVQAACWTNTSAQIRHRETNTGAVKVATLGWVDLRGKDL